MAVDHSGQALSSGYVQPRGPTTESDFGTISVSLRMFHKTEAIDATEIERAMGLAPDVAWSVGDERVTPVGRRLPGVRSQSYWCADLLPERALKAGEAEAAVVEEALDRLQKIRHTLRHFEAIGGKTELYLWLEDCPIKGIEIPWRLAAGMSDLRVNLAIEFFDQFVEEDGP